MNRHLIVVEGFACLCDPRNLCYLGQFPPGGVYRDNLVLGEGPD